jgi:hypothetical protein
MSPVTAPPAAPVSPDSGAARALFKEARQRRRRRWLAGIAVFAVASAVAFVSTVTWLHRPPGHGDGRTSAAGTASARSSVDAVWFDGTRLHIGNLCP